jgi:hypothetical protein
MTALVRAMVVFALLAVAAAAPAGAYPFFQFTSGSARCAQCHVSPAGGGILNAWGREESTDAISGGGDGAFLHGAVTLPDALLLGGDFRVAALANDVGGTEGTELAAFPMQADLTAAIKASEAWTIVGVVGARGRVRSGAPDAMASDASDVSAPSLGSYVISREHYVMWRPDDAEGIYVRGGRFSAPYGLRLADHTAYVRRYLGYNLQDETYGLGVGWMGGTFEIHATGFVYDPLQGAAREEVGGALLVEGQGDYFAVGLSARASVAPTSTRLQAGLHGKLTLGESLLAQVEADGVRELFDGPGDRTQLAIYAGPVWIPHKSIYAGVAYQAFAEDLRVQSVLRQGVDGFVSYFPIAHVEVMASTRAQRIGPHEHAYNAMLQLHYYL